LTTHRQSLGRWGESLAAEYLSEHGYTILEKNVRTPYGEIDLVAIQFHQDCDRPGDDQAVTVFVEVKTRQSAAYGLPEESVTHRKQVHLISAAQSYLQEHPELDASWRIDVIAIQRFRKGLAPAIRHFENAIRD
jgi:putative endonuclease